MPFLDVAAPTVRDPFTSGSPVLPVLFFVIVIAVGVYFLIRAIRRRKNKNRRNP